MKALIQGDFELTLYSLLLNDVESVWIELILLKLKTENWKYCSKIIFKCVNSTVGPIFNEKVVKKWYLWVCKQCTDALFTVEKSTFAAESKKKKAETHIAANVEAANADPNRTSKVNLRSIPLNFLPVRWLLYVIILGLMVMFCLHVNVSW